MPLKRRIAITMPEWSFQVADCVRRACWAEERGFDDVWWGDFGAPDALTTTAFIAARTERIRLGVGVVPVYTRTPALIAATANALAQMLPGRFVLGLGSSSQTMVEGWHGVALEKPLTRVRDTALMVRSISTLGVAAILQSCCVSLAAPAAPCPPSQQCQECPL